MFGGTLPPVGLTRAASSLPSDECLVQAACCVHASWSPQSQHPPPLDVFICRAMQTRGKLWYGLACAH